MQQKKMQLWAKQHKKNAIGYLLEVPAIQITAFVCISLPNIKSQI